MRIGIIGAGSLGRALGQRLASRGHEVMFRGGEPAQEAAIRRSAKVGANAEAVEFGVPCVPEQGEAVPGEVLRP